MESYNSHCNDGSDEYSGTDDSVTDDSSIDGSIINDLRIKKSSTDKSEISNHGINNPGTNNPDTDESGIQNIRTDGSIYTPIDLDRPAFRLLRILKGCDPLIPCELFQAWMMQREVAISYEAISYVWGSPERERRVSINGMLFGITKSLYQALSYLQSEDEDRVVWVDAICINQRNDVERGHQVRHMSDVYKEASRVIYWLGPPTYSTNCCLRGLQLLQEETMQIGTRTWMREQWMAVWKSLEASSRWHPGLEREGLRDLLGRSWFRRVWILQEVANSQAAVVCCGKYSISTRLFTLAPFLMGVNTGPHCQGILDMMPGPFRGSSWFNESRDLYTLLEKFGGSETTEDRDLVYAVLGLSSDAIHVIRPDYQKTEAEVVDTVMTFLFQGLCSRNSNPGTFPSSLRELCQRLKILNEKALETAASDEVNGDAAIAFHLRRRPLLAISWVTVHTAAQNKRKGSQITKVILDNHEMTSREFLHGSKLMEGSAKNDVSGDEVLSLYLSRATHRPPVTDNTLISAACNQTKGDKIMRLLFHNCTITHVPSMAIAEAVRNGTCGHGIVLDFLNLWREVPYRVTEEILRAAALSGPKTRSWASKLLLERKTTRRSPSVDMHRVLEWVLGKNRDISLIEQAIEDENLEILSQLLSCIPGVDYQSALIKACARDISFVELLLEHGGNAVLVQQSLEARSTLLKIAVENDQVATVKLLLEKGAIVNATSSRGATPLHIAIGENLSHLVTILLNAGADPNIQHDEGAAPLIYATAKGHVQVVKILINHGACVDTCCEDKMLIMGTKASLNPKFDWEQNTLLHSAARDGHEHLVELLVQRGVDMESRNMFNQAPLSLAAEQGQVATSQLLLTHGADIESTVELGYTPLFWASYSGQVEVVRTLLRAGANIEAKSFNGRTALHKAAQSGQAAVVKVLLENGADIEATDSQYYRTPLDWAASKGYSDIVQLLLRQSYRKDCYTPLRHQSLLNPVLSRDSHYQSQ